jgi:hypothetical protein
VRWSTPTSRPAAPVSLQTSMPLGESAHIYKTSYIHSLQQAPSTSLLAGSSELELASDCMRFAESVSHSARPSQTVCAGGRSDSDSRGYDRARACVYSANSAALDFCFFPTGPPVRTVGLHTRKNYSECETVAEFKECGNIHTYMAFGGE